MYSLIRSLLFKLDEEKAHHLSLEALRYIPRSCFSQPTWSGKPIQALGLEFAHPVGLAAGLDKNGDYVQALDKIGFSFIEIGTVTPRAQDGHPKPRLFRLPQAHAIINRMGFNNYGVESMVSTISRVRTNAILGINIGKNKETSLSNAADDYLFCLRQVYPHASYVTVNISSPNTPDLRQLQDSDYFNHLMNQLREEQLHLSDQYRRYVPIVIKLSPDESDDALKRMAGTIIQLGIDGIIATNTTCAREAVINLPHGNEAGGLSGRPLLSRSTECLRVLKQIVGDAVPLIGVGGIDSAVTARQKLEAGATLVQLYTGLIYQGPGLVKQILDDL